MDAVFCSALCARIVERNSQNFEKPIKTGRLVVGIDHQGFNAMDQDVWVRKQPIQKSPEHQRHAFEIH